MGKLKKGDVQYYNESVNFMKILEETEEMEIFETSSI